MLPQKHRTDYIDKSISIVYNNSWKVKFSEIRFDKNKTTFIIASMQQALRRVASAERIRVGNLFDRVLGFRG